MLLQAGWEDGCAFNVAAADMHLLLQKCDQACASGVEALLSDNVRRMKAADVWHRRLVIVLTTADAFASPPCRTATTTSLFLS